ncbi:MAG: hypothetical protein L0Z54_06360, partial [Thermoplasmata archaeon]|nr:hypothetical protein [Thermoplasmata archaeon]
MRTLKEEWLMWKEPTDTVELQKSLDEFRWSTTRDGTTPLWITRFQGRCAMPGSKDRFMRDESSDIYVCRTDGAIHRDPFLRKIGSRRGIKMQRYMLIVSTFVFLSIALSGLSSASTIVVDDDMEPWADFATIGEAID